MSPSRLLKLSANWCWREKAVEDSWKADIDGEDTGFKVINLADEVVQISHMYGGMLDDAQPGARESQLRDAVDLQRQLCIPCTTHTHIRHFYLIPPAAHAPSLNPAERIASVLPLKSDCASEEELQQLSDQLHEVFATVGFAYLVNVPLSYDHDDVFRMAGDFFGLPEEVKMRVAKKTFRKTNKNTYRG